MLHYYHYHTVSYNFASYYCILFFCFFYFFSFSKQTFLVFNIIFNFPRKNHNLKKKQKTKNSNTYLEKENFYIKKIVRKQILNFQNPNRLSNKLFIFSFMLFEIYAWFFQIFFLVCFSLSMEEMFKFLANSKIKKKFLKSLF